MVFIWQVVDSDMYMFYGGLCAQCLNSKIVARALKINNNYDGGAKYLPRCVVFID